MIMSLITVESQLTDNSWAIVAVAYKHFIFSQENTFCGLKYVRLREAGSFQNVTKLQNGGYNIVKASVIYLQEAEKCRYRPSRYKIDTGKRS